MRLPGADQPLLAFEVCNAGGPNSLSQSVYEQEQQLLLQHSWAQGELSCHGCCPPCASCLPVLHISHTGAGGCGLHSDAQTGAGGCE